MQVAAHAQSPKDNEAPEELRMGWKWMRWGKMEEGGGLLDQPAGLVDRVTAAMNVYDAFNSFQSNQGTKDEPDRLIEWTKRRPAQMQIVAMVQKLRSENG